MCGLDDATAIRAIRTPFAVVARMQRESRETRLPERTAKYSGTNE
jgi:hypothetical protein